jgi:hypothetical protein
MEQPGPLCRGEVLAQLKYQNGLLWGLGSLLWRLRGCRAAMKEWFKRCGLPTHVNNTIMRIVLLSDGLLASCLRNDLHSSGRGCISYTFPAIRCKSE